MSVVYSISGLKKKKNEGVKKEGLGGERKGKHITL